MYNYSYYQCVIHLWFCTVSGNNNNNNFYQREQNPTQFVEVLLVKLSDMLHSSNFVRPFHRQSFTLYTAYSSESQVHKIYTNISAITLLAEGIHNKFAALF